MKIGEKIHVTYKEEKEEKSSLVHVFISAKME